MTSTETRNPIDVARDLLQATNFQIKNSRSQREVYAFSLKGGRKTTIPSIAEIRDCVNSLAGLVSLEEQELIFSQLDAAETALDILFQNGGVLFTGGELIEDFGTMVPQFAKIRKQDINLVNEYGYHIFKAQMEEGKNFMDFLRISSDFTGNLLLNDNPGAILKLEGENGPFDRISKIFTPLVAYTESAMNTILNEDLHQNRQVTISPSSVLKAYLMPIAHENFLIRQNDSY